MSISIVTVVLDGGSDLALTFESVRQQDYRDVELIVVDGGSQDDTARVLRRYGDVIDKVVHLEDAGIYHAMNTALDYCKNEYVLYLNTRDTLFMASTLRNIMNCKRQDVDVFFGNHVYVDKRKEVFKRSLAYEVSMDLLCSGMVDHRWLSRLPGHQATFVRLDLLRNLRFDTAITICADHDFMVRAYNAGATFQFIDETVSHYIGGGFSAQSPAKLTLEWCALYREQTRDPEAIDRFFFGDVQSPFGPQNAYNGEWVCGNYPLEQAQPEIGIKKPVAWCGPDIRLRSSARHRSSRLRLEGYNPFDGQLLTFFDGDDLIGEMRLDEGWFQRTIKLGAALRPLAIVDVTATRLGKVPSFAGRTVVLALANFAFEPATSSMVPAAPGASISFSQINAKQTAKLLGDGWSGQEDDFIWTVGETADVGLQIAPDVDTIIIRCRGNPFITEDDKRGIDVLLNGRAAGRYHLPRHHDAELEVAVGPLPADGSLTIRLRPLLRVIPPADSRPLGIALLSIEFSDRAGSNSLRGA